MLARRLRRRPNIELTLVQYLVFSENAPDTIVVNMFWSSEIPGTNRIRHIWTGMYRAYFFKVDFDHYLN